MRRITLTLLLCSSLSFLLLPASDGPAQAPVRGKKYALVVGVREYTSAKLRTLKFTENDAEKLAAVLTANGFEVAVLTTSRGEKKADDAPTAKNIRVRLRKLVAGARKEDMVLVGLSGHGLQVRIEDNGKERDEAYFCPTDARPRNTKDGKELSKTMIGMTELLGELDDSGAGLKLMLVDACRDEPVAGRSVEAGAVRLTQGTAALFSCSGGEFAQETPKLKHGVFFHYVIEGLKGEAKNAQGKITWSSLSDYVVTRTQKYVSEEIGLGARQTPEEVKRIRGASPVLITPAKEKIEIAKGPKPGEERSVEIAPGVKMIMCWIPAGKATMGSPATEINRDDDEKEHEYETKGFWLAKYECTQEQYEKVMKTNPSWFDGNNTNKAKRMDTRQFPVDSVSWEDCQEFVKKVNGRVGAGKLLGKGTFCLPHEDEWEYAYRGGKGNKRAFYWGDALNGKVANCVGLYPYGTETKGEYQQSTTKVGSYEKEAPHPWGLCDMSGNVWEWCENLYVSEERHRVLRGGSWYNAARLCRAAERSWFGPSGRNYNYGFRLCFRLGG